MNDERIISIAQKAYDYLKRKCIGKQISTWEILKKVCPDILPDILSIDIESDSDVCAVVDA